MFSQLRERVIIHVTCLLLDLTANFIQCRVSDRSHTKDDKNRNYYC